VDWRVSPSVGGGDDDGDGQKCVEDHGDSVGGVDERCEKERGV
jgi:hypothetical protein